MGTRGLSPGPGSAGASSAGRPAAAAGPPACDPGAEFVSGGAPPVRRAVEAPRSARVGRSAPQRAGQSRAGGAFPAARTSRAPLAGAAAGRAAAALAPILALAALIAFGAAASSRATRRAGRRLGRRPGWSLLGLGLLGACAAEPPPAQRPDLVLLSLDTLRADRLSTYGHHRPTPFLDRFGAEGLVFEHAYASAPHTAPSHMSLFTGLDPAAHGIPNVNARSERFPRLSADIETLPEVLKAAGYRTAVLSDGGNLAPELGFDRGFEWRQFGPERWGLRLDSMDEVLSEVPAHEPLFLFVHAYLTHAPYLPGKAFVGRYTDPAYGGEFRRRYEAAAGVLTPAHAGAAASFLEPFEGLGAADLRYLSDLYDEAVASADDCARRLFARLEAGRPGSARLEVVLSDHGEEFLEHGRLGHRFGLGLELLRVPLLMRGAGLEPRRVADPVGLVALPNTLLALLGFEARPFAEPGFEALARDPAAREERAWFQQLLGRPETGSIEGLIVGGLQRADFRLPEGLEVRYADLETGDLPAPVGALAEELAGRLRARGELNQDRLRAHPLGASLPLSQEQRENLTRLGYVGEGR